MQQVISNTQVKASHQLHSPLYNVERHTMHLL